MSITFPVNFEHRIRDNRRIRFCLGPVIVTRDAIHGRNELELYVSVPNPQSDPRWGRNPTTIEVLAGERIETGEMVYVGDDGRVYRCHPNSHEVDEPHIVEK